MGKIIKKVPKTEYVAEIDWGLLAGVAFGILGFLATAIIGGAIVFHIARWIVREPNHPKVVYKTIVQTQLTSEQQSYINQCTRLEDVPDVHDTPWTCKNPG